MKASEDRERSTPERKGAHRDRAGKAAPRPGRLTPGNAAAPVAEFVRPQLEPEEIAHVES